MEDYIKEVQEKLNKYGCKPSEDVCMKHQQPLIDFGFCEYAPNVKEYIATLLTEARKKWLEQIIIDVQGLADKNPPALLLNSIVDYVYDQLKALDK